MITRFIKILFALSLLELGFSQNVIVVVIDGARYAETIGSANTYIPHLYNDLRPMGTLYTNFRIDNGAGGQSLTNPGHASIATGTWQSISNNGGVYPDKPTVFEYFRKASGAAETQSYLLTGKSKLEYVKYSTAPGYGSSFQARWSGNDNKIDQQVYDLTLSAMSTDHPRLLMVNLAQVDAAGHAGNEGVYRDAVVNADNIVYLLWQNIQSGYGGYTAVNTTMLITNDHGRHTTDFTNHGDGCDGCTHLMLLALGRNVAQGIENSDLHYQIDLAPTVGDLLGFSTPQALGTSLYQGEKPLPVELTRFSAVAFERTVKLFWRTETETNNHGFEIHRSSIRNRWDVLGFVNGLGNSNSPKEYTFTDFLVPSSAGTPLLSYRLKQIDADGTYEYSRIVEIEINPSTILEQIQNYPNPFNPRTTIRYNLPSPGKVTLTIYDILGREIAALVNEEQSAGWKEVRWEAANQASGILFCKLQAGTLTQARKMILLK